MHAYIQSSSLQIQINKQKGLSMIYIQCLCFSYIFGYIYSTISFISNFYLKQNLAISEWSEKSIRTFQLKIVLQSSDYIDKKSHNISEMEKIQLQPIYYDSVLLKKMTSFPKVLDEIQFQMDQWPKETALDDLVQCFEQLQTFIRSQSTWAESICTIEELNKVEEDINLVLKLFRIQKLYISKFWKPPYGYRRIEASIAHFYCILQLFIRAIIPYETMTMYECKAARKLCIKLEDLQNLIRKVTDRMKAIYTFLNRPQYSEEKDIVQIFFKNLEFFFQNIPKIKKLKMFHVPELLKFVCITNSIQFSEVPSPTKKNKRNFSIAKIRHREAQLKRQYHSLQNITKKNVQLLHMRKSQSSIEFNFEASIDENNFRKQQKFIPPFKIPLWIRRHSIVRRKQSVPKIEPFFKMKSNTEVLRKKSSTKILSSVESRNQTLSPPKGSISSKMRRNTKIREKKLDIKVNVAGQQVEDQRQVGNKIKQHRKKLQEEKLDFILSSVNPISLNNTQVLHSKKVKALSCLEELRIRYRISQILKR